MHEFTHHTLSHARLPLWAEEGLTQLMEYAVAGTQNFSPSGEMMVLHRRHWDDEALDRLIDGSAFQSPHGREAELAYHLAQTVVRACMATHRNRFIEFVHECRRTSVELAVRRVYRVTEKQFLRVALTL